MDLISQLAYDGIADRVSHHGEYRQTMMLHQPVGETTPAMCSCGHLSWWHCEVVQSVVYVLFFA